MKKFCAFLLLIAFALLLTTACTNIKLFYYGSNFGNEIKATYKYFYGTETKKINLETGDILKVDYASVVELGTLTIVLVDPKKKEVHTFETDQSGTLEYVAKTSGKYQLIITGEATKGKFHLSWEIER